MNDETTNPAPANTSSLKDFAIFLGCAIVLALAFFIWIKRSTVRPDGGLAVGQPVPAINVEGWLNGGPITAQQMQGKTVVINGWFPACINCRREAPELVELYEKYHPQGVLFLGLTHEGTGSLPQIEAFLKQTGITWPNGYGALQTMIAFEAESFPVVWVIDPQGKVIWNRESSASLDDVLADAVPSKSP